MKITIYKRAWADDNANLNKEWLAHMDMGNDIYMSFFGKSDEECRTKAQSFWDKETARQHKNVGTSELTPFEFVSNVTVVKTPGPSRGHANTGNIWIVHTKTKQATRINPNDLGDYLAKGYIRGKKL